MKNNFVQVILRLVFETRRSGRNNSIGCGGVQDLRKMIEITVLDSYSLSR